MAAAGSGDGAAGLRVETEALLRRSERLKSATGAFHRRLVAETDALAADAGALRAAVADVDAAASACAGGGGGAGTGAARGDEAALARAAARAARRLLGSPDLNAFLPRKRNAPFVRLFLGNEVDVVSPRQDARLKLKEEYNQYRNWTTVLYIAFPAVLVSLQMSGAVSRFALGLLTTLYHAWLLHFYSALALRESVLLSNGSHIRAWWIRHHFFFIGLSLVMLTCSYASEPCRAFMQRFNVWACFQGLIMLLQNRYQRQRTYTRIALGRDGSMDVVAADGSGMRGQVLLLIPVLWALQGWELWLGVSLLRDQLLAAFAANAAGATLGEQLAALFSHPDEGVGSSAASIVPGSGQLWLCGVLLSVIAVGNLHTTTVTLVNKFAARRERRPASIARDLQSLAAKDD